MFSKWCMVTALVALGAGFGLDKAIAAQPGPADAEEGVQVLTRGPVHEAFAETVTFDPEPGIVVPKAPPAAIEELPPDQRPEGANVAWIPGYWGWDDERSDFLWVSGIWRALPPGRQWVPGYWGKSGQGFQWTSGYWADAKVSEVEYLPEPPETVEAGPNIAAPSADSTWLPGCWVWHQGRYAWRPGFWATVQPDWVWVPAHYVWAPRGYVFVDGYWDYSIGRRGVLFAPVYFNRGRVRAAGLLLLACDGDRPGRVHQPSLLAAAIPPLLLRRLLRRQLPERRVLPVVFVPIQPLRLRSDLRSPALAASAGPCNGSTASQRTSRTAAITRMPDRRARGRPREHSASGVNYGQRERPRGCRAARPTDEEQRQLGCDSSRWTRQRDRSSPSTGKRSRRFREERQKLETTAAGASSRKALQGIRAGQSETSQVSDCGEASR